MLLVEKRRKKLEKLGKGDDYVGLGTWEPVGDCGNLWEPEGHWGSNRGVGAQCARCVEPICGGMCSCRFGGRPAAEGTLTTASEGCPLENRSLTWLQWLGTLKISSLLSHLACDGEHFDYGVQGKCVLLSLAAATTFGHAQATMEALNLHFNRR